MPPIVPTRPQALSLAPLSAAALALVLVGLPGCGGGHDNPASSEAAAPPATDGATPPGTPAPETPAAVQVLTGTVTLGKAVAALPEGTVVCADRNADLSCGDSEERATADANGAYSLDLFDAISPDTLLLIAELPAHVSSAQRSVPASTLLAPASLGQISGLSTVLQWAAQGDSPLTALARLTPETLSAWALSQGLAADLDLLSISDGRSQSLNGVLATAQALVQATLAATPTRDAASRQAAQAISPVLTRYIDRSSGSLLPTVTAHTLASEAAYAIHGNSECRPPEIVATVELNTEAAAAIESREDYLRATLAVTTPDGATTVLPTQVRGRGNSTWDMAKKPYRLKLDAATPLLGMSANRDWAMLANYADKTLMRNAVAFCLGRMFDFDFTPDSRYIELTLNGDYLGIYQVSDQVEVRATRVAIDETVLSDTDQALGFLVEIDANYLTEEHWFISPREYPYVIKSEITANQVALVRDYISGFETALFGENYLDEDEGYLRYLDADSTVDFYLTNEILRNNDVFYSSTYLHRQRDGLLRFGPLWDFDLAGGNITFGGNDAAEGWWVRVTSPYMWRLIDGDRRFRQHLLARWDYLQRRMPDIQQFLSTGAQNLEAAQQRNYARWPTLDQIVWPTPVALGSWAAEVDHLKTWLDTRTRWMAQQYQAQGEQATPAASRHGHIAN